MSRALEVRSPRWFVRAGAASVFALSALGVAIPKSSAPVFGWSSAASSGATVAVGPPVSPRCADPSFAGAAVVVGTDGTDAIDLSGGPPRDTIVVALGGNDRINGGTGRNCVDAGAGDDQVEGGPRDDILLGGAGDDRIEGLGGADLIDGGPGTDRCRGANRSEVTNCEKTLR